MIKEANCQIVNVGYLKRESVRLSSSSSLQILQGLFKLHGRDGSNKNSRRGVKYDHVKLGHYVETLGAKLDKVSKHE